MKTLNAIVTVLALLLIPVNAKAYHWQSPYSYCGGNPVNVIDPTGCDTLNIAFNQGKWIFSDPIIAKGDGVFNVTIDGVTNAYTFSEGEYGDRVDALNLESNEDYTITAILSLKSRTK